MGGYIYAGIVILLAAAIFFLFLLSREWKKEKASGQEEWPKEKLILGLLLLFVSALGLAAVLGLDQTKVKAAAQKVKDSLSSLREKLFQGER